ncbi:MAG: monovalent cation/H(+) antiporter subunit G [Longimicrobiales bacterium]|nr:monovalent cation/H(+) antiporter subunit G [Longimicrobiales bacterium]
MDLVLDVLSWGSIALGLFFMLVGAYGILRLPDVYTRLHAAGMTDTMGAGFLLLGMALQTVGDIAHGETSYGFVLIRLVFIYVFLLFTSPIACHALARAGIASGVKPWSDEREGES